MEQGALFHLSELDPESVYLLKATSNKYLLCRWFLDRHGFVVVTNVMPKEENTKCIKGMLSLKSQGLLGVKH